MYKYGWMYLLELLSGNRITILQPPNPNFFGASAAQSFRAHRAITYSARLRPLQLVLGFLFGRALANMYIHTYHPPHLLHSAK